MSILMKKAEKYLETAQLEIDNETLYVFCTDSKGKYLKYSTPRIYHEHFLWLCKGGRNTKDGVDLIDNELKKLHTQYKNIKLIFWHATCDISCKRGKYIFLRNENGNEAIEKLKYQYNRLMDIISNYNNVRLYLLEIPPISIKLWNQLHGYGYCDKITDKEINEQVKKHNELIQELNISLNTVSPRFEFDYLKSKKHTSAKPLQQVTYSYSFLVSNDGVHPKEIIAKKWLHKIIEKVNQY